MSKKNTDTLPLIMLDISFYCSAEINVAELNYMLSPNNSFVQKDTISNVQYFSSFMNALQLGFSRPLVVPLFGLNWDVSPKLNIQGDLPK